MKSVVESNRKSSLIPKPTTTTVTKHDTNLKGTTAPTIKKVPLSITNNNIRKSTTMLSSKRKNNEKDPARSIRPRVDTGLRRSSSSSTSTASNKATNKKTTIVSKKPLSRAPPKDLRTKISDMEDARHANEAKIAELSKDWKELEDTVANKETESREVSQRLVELQTMREVEERTHGDEMEILKSQHLQQNRTLEEINTNLLGKLTDMQNEASTMKQRTQNASKQHQIAQSENIALQETISRTSASFIELEAELMSTKSQHEMTDKKLTERQHYIDELKQEIQGTNAELKELETQLLGGEKMRRKLHNTIQELKGNIRVFCRVRPPLESEKSREGNLAQIRYYGEDGEKLELTETHCSTLGKKTTKSHPFSFDKVFAPETTQEECFEEISQLVQSALDGYNVCIFAYGQTGSGKTYTMQGPSGPTSQSSGMIPRAVQQIYEVTQKLSERGWTYTMEGQFLEIYNETVHDLLGDTSNYGKVKHDIRHEKNGKTTVTDMTTVILDSPSKVNMMLRKASQNRATGATNLNERSSRSHSVFMLRLTGNNATTNERSSGVLNLIDLAGSERLALSGSTGDRLRETQAINKSLSCLGDVIHALANNKEGGHVPFRNSKLTYLLQNSLGGNSKTLMFVNISPLSEHFGETICSLRFATKVNSCRIGTAKKLRV
ncbi:P-loop containing nucleoside triphosphate hydrolase protein [Phascolomyces articulosus]|uniref:Kinesin-like protein n=1 Tax=Phascolomyces articulosus TaxID=60185 RepID=A0AAD5KQJ5_9FUNG|nr:P-loop containing nucleoside triphosphate hydrolase protein [Phascolomyces articulosus]